MQSFNLVKSFAPMRFYTEFKQWRKTESKTQIMSQEKILLISTFSKDFFVFQCNLPESIYTLLYGEQILKKLTFKKV